MDQVRAAVFSSLAERVEGAAVLDLFAGTGGLGIEALSRGATSAVFVEKDRGTADCIRQNLAKARLETGGEVICSDAHGYCSRSARNPSYRRFDLIFADPPYQTKDHPEDIATRLLRDDHLRTLLAPEGIFVLEKSPRTPLLVAEHLWQVLRRKRYGTAEVVFLARVAAAPSHPPPERHPS